MVIECIHNYALDELIMTSFSSRDVIRMLEKDGWSVVRISDSHHHFRHQVKPGTVTVPHPVKDMKKGTLRSIFRQAGIK
jgi:predicted RNA binding protein YcfA (HicA-like mRNA interferase family)